MGGATFSGGTAATSLVLGFRRPSDFGEVSARELGFRARRLLWRLPAMELPTSLPVRLGLSRTKPVELGAPGLCVWGEGEGKCHATDGVLLGQSPGPQSPAGVILQQHHRSQAPMV